jgi:hypothetical protein
VRFERNEGVSNNEVLNENNNERKCDGIPRTKTAHE